MPVCDRCGKGYEASERVCPSCGMPPDSTPPRCGPVAMLAMRIAWAAAFIAAIVCVLGGVIAVISRCMVWRSTPHLYFGASGLRPTRGPWHGDSLCRGRELSDRLTNRPS